MIRSLVTSLVITSHEHSDVLKLINKDAASVLVKKFSSFAHTQVHNNYLGLYQ